MEGVIWLLPGLWGRTIFCRCGIETDHQQEEHHFLQKKKKNLFCQILGSKCEGLERTQSNL